MRLKLYSIPILKYTEIIFLFILFSWISFFPEPIQAQYGIYTRIFLGIFLAFLLLDKRNFKHLFNFYDWFLWLFLICLLAGTASAIDKSVAWRTYSYAAITLLLVFYIGKGLYLEGTDQNIVSSVICICSSLVALIGILELYFGKNILYENFIANLFYERYIKYHPRPMSTQLNPAILGSYLLGCLPFNFYLLRNKPFYIRILGILSALLSIIIIVLTFSRGVFLGLIVLLLFYLWNRQKKKIFFLSIFCLILLIAFCSYQKNVNLNRFGFNRFISGSYDSIISEYRLNRVKMAFKILKDYPLFGIGFNHFRIRFNEYCEEKELFTEFMIPDNMYLTFLAETGIIGTLGFLTFIILLLKKGLYVLHKLKEDARKQMLVICLASLVGLLVNMGAYDLFYWNNPYMIFCLLCGFIAALTLEPKEIKQ